MKTFTCTLLIAALIALLTSTILFPVREYESVLVTQFGRPVRDIITEPGGHLKLPYQRVIRFDRRLRLFDPAPAEFLTKDKKNVVVDTFMTWRIRDPKTFLDAVGGDAVRAELNLQDYLASELSKAMGAVPLDTLFTVETTSAYAAVEQALLEACRTHAEEQFGIEINGLRIKRLGFPQQNRQAVFERMKEERRREAMAYRAAGEEEAAKIRANADRTRGEILAASMEKAEIIRGEAEAKAIEIFSDSHGMDPEFYEFTRAMEAYRKVLREQATLVFSSDSRFFRILSQGVPAMDAPVENRKPQP